MSIARKQQALTPACCQLSSRPCRLQQRRLTLPDRHCLARMIAVFIRGAAAQQQRSPWSVLTLRSLWLTPLPKLSTSRRRSARRSWCGSDRSRNPIKLRRISSKAQFRAQTTSNQPTGCLWRFDPLPCSRAERCWSLEPSLLAKHLRYLSEHCAGVLPGHHLRRSGGPHAFLRRASAGPRPADAAPGSLESSHSPVSEPQPRFGASKACRIASISCCSACRRGGSLPSVLFLVLERT